MRGFGEYDLDIRMQKDSVAEIVASLNAAGVRYLIVGGLAVVAHGYLRFTADVDIVLAVEPENVIAALSALRNLEYLPPAPVSLMDFADPSLRKKWADEKNMRVFSLFSAKHPGTDVGLFLEPPFNFECNCQGQVDGRRRRRSGTVLQCDDLIELKTRVGCPRDMEDVLHLKRLRDQS